MFGRNKVKEKNMLIYNTTLSSMLEEGQEDNLDKRKDQRILFTRSRKGWCIAYTAHCSCTQSP